MPEPGVQPFCAGKKSASSHETDVGMASEFDSPLSVDAPGTTQAIDSSSVLANTDRQKSQDLAPENSNGSLQAVGAYHAFGLIATALSKKISPNAP